MSSFDRGTLWLSRAAGFFSLLAAVFVCLQRVEMYQGGRDSHDLAVAANTRKDKTGQLAQQMELQPSATKDQANATKGIAGERLSRRTRPSS